MAEKDAVFLESRDGMLKMWLDGNHLLMQTPDGRIARLTREQWNGLVKTMQKFYNDPDRRDTDTIHIDLSPFTIDN